MKIRSCLFLTFIASLTLLSCNKKKDKIDDVYIRPASVVFDKQDTTSIQQTVNQFVEALNANDISSASSMLKVVNKTKIEDLPVEKRQQFENIFTRIPFYGCEIISFALSSNTDNKVGIALKLTPKADVETGKGIMKLIINPVQIDNHWYLTLRDEYADGIDHIEETDH